MNFIWDIVLQAEAQGIDKAGLSFQQAEHYSPYCEQSFPYINQHWLDSTVIDINALYRFSHIFQEILHPDLLNCLEHQDLAEFADAFFDIVVHLLSEIDLKYGLTRREYFTRQLRAELLYGLYGQTAATAVALMTRQMQFDIAGELLTQLQTGSSLRVFRRVIRSTYPGSLLYQSNYHPQELLLYLGKKPTDQSRQIVQFLLDLFLPVNFSIRLFWQYHFGILGVDATMQADSIALF